MKVVNINRVLLIGIIGLIILNTSALIYQKYLDKKAIIPQVKEQENKNDTFAIMLEQSDGTYEKITSTLFEQPGYVFNSARSVCVDVKGQKLNNVLSYNETTKQMAIRTNNTAYCYVYFDKGLGLQIKDSNPNRLSTEVKGAMYRFQGQQTDNVENYICFGTSDKAQCTSDTNHYMYRIIGIEAETGRVKVIKKEALDNTIPWWDNYDEDITFPESKIYEAINGSQFLTNTSYVPTEWYNKISNNTWFYGDMLGTNTTGANQTGAELYLTETGQKETWWDNRADENTPGAIQTMVGDEKSPYYGNTVYYTVGKGKWTDTFTSKVSLMYLHDYYFSVSDDANCQYNEGNYAICKTGWMHLSQNDTTSPSPYEWTISRFGFYPYFGVFVGNIVHSIGYSDSYNVNILCSVRPVFYIEASNELKDGIGTIDNPFTIVE